jgi:hypothetical protein
MIAPLRRLGVLGLACALPSALLACSASDDGGGADASVDAAYDTARCLIAGNFGALGARTGTTSLGPSSLTVQLEPGPPRDSFFINLRAGRGVFPGNPMAGTYAIAGADAAQGTCGLCLSILADIVAMQGPGKIYQATTGSVTLTSTSPPAGSLTNVGFVEVDGAGAAVPAGCTGSIASMQFSM